MSATSLPQSADRLSQTKHSAPTTTSVTPATSFDNISSTGQQFSGVAGLRAHAANLTTATATAKPSAQGMESPPPTPRHVKSHPTIATTTTTATATISSSGSSSSSDVGAVGNADDSWTLNHPTAPTPTASATATSTATATPIAPITPEADDADDALLVQEIAEGLGMDPFLVRCGLATPANVAAQASRPIAPSSAHEPIRRRHSAPEPGVVKKIQRARKFLRMLYKALLVSVAANCVFVLCVIFFASTNHALVLSTQAGTCLTMILVAQCVPSLHENSVHFRLYISVLVTNSIGLVMHLWQQLFQRAEAAASATHSKQQPELTACNKSALTPPVPATASTATTESSVSDEASKKQD
ncbi:hypothetical protein CAOG_009481 [Capsaspora owczarzaki ATCC 30864]|uniref:Uncharacterized protein n=1 Tax=Capsaspora owczarzaki (strain ATCC 30864) TaxID=595528 RepID=A0A0D2WLG8_CAPO3|nr:hypothetical protein CAOG_009481 [Capsaspora owczarzaki ATCC 30864]